MIPAESKASQNNLKVIALRLSEQARKQHIQGIRREAKRDRALRCVRCKQAGVDDFLKHATRTPLRQSGDPCDLAPLELAANERFLEQPRRFRLQCIASLDIVSETPR